MQPSKEPLLIRHNHIHPQFFKPRFPINERIQTNIKKSFKANCLPDGKYNFELCYQITFEFL